MYNYTYDKNILTSILLMVLVCALFTSCDFRGSNVHNFNHKTIEEKNRKDNAKSILISTSISEQPKTKFTADQEHSSISFKTKHWEIVDIIGWFADFEVIMYSDSVDFTDAVVYAEVHPKSLEMPNLKMQGTALKEPYLNSDMFPKATFKSDRMIKNADHSYLLPGILSINGIERKMDFDVIFNGYAYPGEKSICGFDVRGEINRRDFHVGIEDTLHSGRKVHSDTIYLNMALRME